MMRERANPGDYVFIGYGSTVRRFRVVSRDERGMLHVRDDDRRDFQIDETSVRAIRPPEPQR